MQQIIVIVIRVVHGTIYFFIIRVVHGTNYCLYYTGGIWNYLLSLLYG